MYIKKEGLFLQEHNNKKASMKVKNFRSNSTMTFLVHCYHNIIVFIMRLIHQHNGIDRLEKNDQR